MSRVKTPKKKVKQVDNSISHIWSPQWNSDFFYTNHKKYEYSAGILTLLVNRHWRAEIECIVISNSCQLASCRKAPCSTFVCFRQANIRGILIESINLSRYIKGRDYTYLPSSNTTQEAASLMAGSTWKIACLGSALAQSKRPISHQT